MSVEDYGVDMHNDTIVAKMSLVHRIASWTPITSGYDKLNTLDLQKALQKDSLQGWLNFGFNSMISNRQNQADDLTLYSLDKFRDYMIKHGYPLGFDEQLAIRTPKNKDALRNIVQDIEFIGILRNYQHTMLIHQEGFQNSRERISFLLGKLDNYFERKRCRT